VQVTGEGLDEAAETPLPAVTVSEEDLRRRDPADLQDVFAGETSVSVGGSLAINQKVYVHGVEEVQLAVTVDGGRQNNKVFHHNATTLMDPSLLKVVRVDPGVAPADAGPGALAGSIAYETKDARDLLDPGESLGGLAKLSYDSNGDGVTATGTAYAMGSGFEALAHVNRAVGSDYEAGDGSRMSGTGADLLGLLGKFAYQAPGGDRVELSYERIQDDAARPFRANFLGLVGRPDVLRVYDLVRQNAVMTYTDERPDGWWDPKLVVAYNVSDIAVLDPYGSVASTESFSAKFENRFDVGIGKITGGVDMFRDRAKYSDPSDQMQEKSTNLGVYAQARLQPSEAAEISFGGRVDHTRFTGIDGTRIDETGFSGNVAGAYTVAEIVTLRAGYSHVWGGIPLAENFILNPTWSYAGGVKPVRADNVVAGISVMLGGVEISGDFYRTEIHDARLPTYGGGPGISHDLRTKGVDLAVRYDWSSGFLRVAYSHIDARIDGAVADSYTGQYLATPIGDLLAVEGEYRFGASGFSMGGDVAVAFDNQDTVRAGGQALPGYELVNLFIAYAPPSLPELEVRLGVRNLFDETYADRASYGQDFDSVKPLLEPGRSVRATIRLQL
jgi:hemoglobin/transferrin/lactoferrin receptor protein